MDLCTQRESQDTLEQDGNIWIIYHLIAILTCVFFLRWTDIIMIRGFLEAAKLQDNPVNQLCKHMDWSLVFTQEDLGNLNIFLSLMGRSEFLFSKLNSEKERKYEIQGKHYKSLYGSNTRLVECDFYRN